MENTTMRSDAQKKADRVYRAKNVKQIQVKFYKNTDQDLIEYIESLDNVQGTIKQAIREHMNKGSE